MQDSLINTTASTGSMRDYEYSIKYEGCKNDSRLIADKICLKQLTEAESRTLISIANMFHVIAVALVQINSELTNRVKSSSQHLEFYMKTVIYLHLTCIELNHILLEYH